MYFSLIELRKFVELLSYHNHVLYYQVHYLFYLISFFVQNLKKETQIIPLENIQDPLITFENFEVKKFRINTIRHWIIYHEEIIFYYDTAKDENNFNVKIGYKDEDNERISFKFFKRDYLDGEFQELACPVKIKTLHKIAHFIAIKEYKTIFHNCRDSIQMLLRFLNQNHPQFYKPVFEKCLLPSYWNYEQNEMAAEAYVDNQLQFQVVIIINDNRLVFSNQLVMFSVLFKRNNHQYQLFKKINIQKQQIDLRMTKRQYTKNELCQIIDQLCQYFPRDALRQFKKHHVGQQI